MATALRAQQWQDHLNERQGAEEIGFKVFAGDVDIDLFDHSESVVTGIADNDIETTEVLRAALCGCELVGSFETEQTKLIGDIMQSTDALRGRKLAIYIDMENALLEALIKAWPDAGDRPALHLLAAVSMGVLRLSMDQWRQGDGTRQLADYVRQNFLLLPQQA
jgi:hypothetical protein